MSSIISFTLKIIGILIGIYILYLVRDFVVFLILGFILASALKPTIDSLEKKKIPRVISALFIFLLIFFLISSVFYLVFPPLFREIQDFIINFPQKERFLEWFPQVNEWVKELKRIELDKGFSFDVFKDLQSFLGSISQIVFSFLDILYKIFRNIINFIFIFIVAFYLIIEKRIGEKIANFLFSNTKSKEKFLKYWQISEKISGRWLSSYVILGFIIGILVFISLSLLRVEYKLTLAVLAGFLEIVPWLGPILSGVAGFSFAFIQEGLGLALWTIFAFFIIQQLENYLIVPFIMRKRINLNPLLSIIALFVGGRLMGILGMILAIPLTTISLIIWKEEMIDKRK